MMQEDPDDHMPDKMSIWTTLGGYAIGAIIIFLMFYLALPSTQSLN